MKIFSTKRRIYLDYASLTPIDPRVLQVIKKYSSPKYANPSSWYREGVVAKEAMNDARKRVAGFINAHPDEIVFTSGGTESNNIALQGVVTAYVENMDAGALLASSNKGDAIKPHIIISCIEHSSIIETAKALENLGCEATKIPVDKNGVVLLDELKKAIKPNTILISIMTVNNEIGTIQPIREIAKIIRQARSKFAQNNSTHSADKGTGARNTYPLFHMDAAQAGLYQDLNVEQLGIDLLTLDAGKLYGPRGIGALYVKRKVLISKSLIRPIMFGGGQEGGLRSGTENIPAIMGFSEALDIAKKEREKETSRVSQLREMFIVGLKKIRADIVVNSAVESAVSPHILNISIPGIDNEFFVMQLDAAGIACSTKSSCLHDEDESYVLKAIGADSNTSIRFSFGRWTTKGEIMKTLAIVKDIL
jgi:cysteine desulfurase